MGTLKAGMAKVVVTPPVGTQLAGYAGRTDPSTGVSDDLYAKALVLDDGDERLALVVCDLNRVRHRHGERDARRHTATKWCQA